MELLVFDGSYDAYFWVLCVDKFCKVRGISEKEKMALAATAMSGSALKWLNWWTPRHPGVDWNMFTISLLWRFKPEDRCILPIVDDEEEPDQESSPLTKLDNSSEELTNVLKAWDAFLLLTDEMEVPLTKVVNGGNVYLPDATTTSTDELIENPKSLGDSKPQELATIIPLQENFRFPSSDSLLIKDCLLPRHLAPFDGTDYLEDEPIVASITLSSSVKINTTPISAMLPLHFISLFDPGGNHLVTLSLLPEPLDWTHEAVGSSPPPPEPPDCKYRVMDLFIALCYPLKPTCVLGNSAFVLELNSKFWNIRTACQVFAEMSNMLVCLNSLFCMCITTGRLNEKEFISYDALSNRLGTSMMDPGLTQRFRAIISLSIRATWIPHFEKLSWDQFALPVINLRKFARVSLNIPKSMPPPLKLPCRSIQKVTAEFKVTWELAMLLPPLKPPNRVEIPMVRNSNSYANGLGIWLVLELTLRPPAKPPDLKSLVENRVTSKSSYRGFYSGIHTNHCSLQSLIENICYFVLIST